MSRRIRVSLDNIAMGFKKADGLLYLEDDHLVLELQEMDAILELIKEEVKTYKINISQLDEIALTKKWFRRYIDIDAKNMKATQNIPGSAQGRIRLSIPRDEKDEARQLISRVQLLLSEQKLQELDQ